MGEGPARMRFKFSGTVWHYLNPNAVYFVSLPEDLSAEILGLVGTSLNPWGTVPVDATIDDTTWYSSMFPRNEGAYYDLPLRAKIRNKLGLVDGQQVTVSISIEIPW
jgi:hypothetical protein